MNTEMTQGRGRKFLALVLGFMLVMTLLAEIASPVSAASGDIIASGNCGAPGDDLTYKVVENSDGATNSLIVEGSGELIDNGGIPWTKYADTITSVSLPEGLTKITYNAFGNFSKLKSITIPESVTAIKDGVFNGCTSLTDVYYGGTEAQWNKITIGSNNDPVTANANLTIHYDENIGDATEITNVAITDIAKPKTAEKLDTKAACATEGVATTTPNVAWSMKGYNGSSTSVTGKALGSKVYTTRITLNAAKGYSFADTANVAATVGGETATVASNSTSKTLYVTYTYEQTDKPNLVSIKQPAAVTGVKNGSAKTLSGLKISGWTYITVNDSSVTTENVTWDIDGAEYDPSVLEEQTFVVKGTLRLRDSIQNTNNVPLDVQVRVTVDKADATESPKANVDSGTYTENKEIKLSRKTSGATIYYTTDGSKPTKESTEYTGPIQISTKKLGEPVKTTVKAIAVKDGMYDSEVSEFVYTIKLPLAVPETKATRASYNGIKVTWNKVPQASGYQIFRATSGSGVYHLIKTVDSKSVSYVNTKLTTGKTY